MNKKCYKLEKLNYSNGLLDLDATYIIHLEGNGRLKHILYQLKEYKPTNLIYIVHNKGYKKCEKKLHLHEPQIDLIDAFIYIFNDAKSKNYENILILEDDFIFSSKIKDPKTRKSVVSFINEKNKNNETFIYMLGCLPVLQKPYGDNTNQLLCGMGTHACIYPKKCIEKILNSDQTTFIDWDFHQFTNFTRYMFYEPLCYQLFPETENQKNWKSFGGLKYLFLLLVKFCKLDVKPEPGYAIFYRGSMILYFMFAIILICLLAFALSKLKNI